MASKISDLPLYRNLCAIIHHEELHLNPGGGGKEAAPHGLRNTGE
jgi:hypothetical protein